MASIEQVVSEIAHSVQQPNSVPVRRAIRLAVIHNRNKLIRQSFQNHNYIDKVLQQRFRITLKNIEDGDTNILQELGLDWEDYLGEFASGQRIIKRSVQRVPRPVRLDNNLPFLSVRTTGFANPVIIPFIREGVSKYYKSVPGMCQVLSYDYINQHIYLDILKSDKYKNLESIIVESPFEYPTIIDDEETVYSGIQEEHCDGNKTYTADDEFMISEDMIYDIKKLVLDEFNISMFRQTNEVPLENQMK